MISTINTPLVLFVLPAFNEEGSLAKVANELLKFADVLIVDDGSTDNTFSIASSLPLFVLSHHSNVGYDATITSGFHFAIQNGYDFMIN